MKGMLLMKKRLMHGNVAVVVWTMSYNHSSQCRFLSWQDGSLKKAGVLLMLPTHYRTVAVFLSHLFSWRVVVFHDAALG